MTVLYKVGDKVRVREDLKVGEIYGREIFAQHMSSFRGKTVEIDDVWNSGGYNLKEDDENWLFTDEMLEPIEDPLATKIEERNNKPVKMISDENLLNDNDPIKPSHYRKGEIDLYESWYRTYPFNEFRAIMSAIAERYMKRDKDNRIQDLDKAIYSLTRLKEYEELEK